ncbi:MAG: tautomerase family protein [Dehalococcoidia bacterium]|jgi:4-oxalocrotonate tautomerase
MPHIIIKMYPGRTVEQKNRLAAAITNCVTSIAQCGQETVSVAVEEIVAEDWAEQVYRPDIIEKEATLVKKPGYKLSDCK